MATSWTDAEVMKLIELWREQEIQEQLEGSKRNKHVYAKLSSELAKHGIEKSGERCRCKVKKLRQEYKKIKDSKNRRHSYDKKSSPLRSYSLPRRCWSSYTTSPSLR